MTVASNESVEKNRGRISPEMQGKLQVPQSGKLRIRSSPQVQEVNVKKRFDVPDSNTQ